MILLTIKLKWRTFENLETQIVYLFVYYYYKSHNKRGQKQNERVKLAWPLVTDQGGTSSQVWGMGQQSSLNHIEEKHGEGNREKRHNAFDTD